MYRKIIIAIIALSFIIYITPWFIYGISLLAIEERPVYSNNEANEQVLAETWAENQGNGPYPFMYSEDFKVDTLTPWSYIDYDYCEGREIKDSGDIHYCIYGRYKGIMPLMYLSLHVLDKENNDMYPSTSLEELELATLMVWVSRNMTSEEIAKYLFENKVQ